MYSLNKMQFQQSLFFCNRTPSVIPTSCDIFMVQKVAVNRRVTGRQVALQSPYSPAITPGNHHSRVSGPDVFIDINYGQCPRSIRRTTNGNIFIRIRNCPLNVANSIFKQRDFLLGDEGLTSPIAFCLTIFLNFESLF